jgi:hypothetical protein
VRLRVLFQEMLRVCLQVLFVSVRVRVCLICCDGAFQMICLALRHHHDEKRTMVLWTSIQTVVCAASRFTCVCAGHVWVCVCICVCLL